MASPQDTRLASLGLLLGAGMIAYSYFKHRQQQGNGTAATGGSVGSSATGLSGRGGKTLADLQHFADQSGAGLSTYDANDYTLTPNPGNTQYDPYQLGAQAHSEGFDVAVKAGQLHIQVPYHE